MLICDTGPLYAVLNRKDQDHERCLALLESHSGPLIVPSPVLTEVCWLLESRIGPDAEVRFLRSIVDGELTLEPLALDDVARMAELVRVYSNFPLGAADASVIAVAERLNAHEVATLDHRHFHAVKPKHLTALTLLP
jgi:hypothetical protein